MDRLTLLQKLGIYAALFVFMLFILMPFIEMFRVSLRPMTHLMAADFTWWSDDFSFQAYRDMGVTVPRLGRYILNSIFIATSVTCLTMVCVVPAAYAYARLDFPFKSISLAVNNGLTVELAGGSVMTLPVDAGTVRTGDAVEVGIRPENVDLGPGLTVTVNVLERLGGASITYGTLGGVRFCASLPGDAAIAEGQTIRLSVNPRDAHVFDATGKVLRRLQAPALVA